MRMGKWAILVVVVAVAFTPLVYAGNDVLGEIEFDGKSKVEKTSGVWVDGQYLGYLKELKGSKKVLLLPGEHVITIRQGGYQDFVQRVELRPGEKKVVEVVMQKAPTGAMPHSTATVKLAVQPTRAAVFIDGQFMGHAAEFQGLGRGVLVAPGQHTIKIALPGYQTFTTKITASANQKVEVKTSLVQSNGTTDDPLINAAGEGRTPAPPPEPAPPPQMQ
jgi:PEGA domain